MVRVSEIVLQLQILVCLFLLIGLSVYIMTTNTNTSFSQNMTSSMVDNDRTVHIDLISTEAEVPELKYLSFNPPEIIIKPNTTVVWTNQDTQIHRILSVDPCPFPADACKYIMNNNTGYVPFDSSYLEPGELFKFTFENPGKHVFRDSESALQGTVFVEN